MISLCGSDHENQALPLLTCPPCRRIDLHPGWRKRIRYWWSEGHGDNNRVYCSDGSLKMQLESMGSHVVIKPIEWR